MKNIFHNALLCKNCKNKTTIIIQFPLTIFQKEYHQNDFQKKSILKKKFLGKNNHFQKNIFEEKKGF
jgi:hypothetical protein